MEQYQKEYNLFIRPETNTPGHVQTSLDGLIKYLSGQYAEFNLKMVAALREFRRIKSEIIDQTDANDKPISAVKADVIADATNEAAAYELARAHVNNIDMMMKALSYHADK